MKDLQKIIDDAPEGATHVDKDNSYLAYDKNKNEWFVWTSDHSGYHIIYSTSICNPRSLADIKQILELQEQNEELINSLQGLVDAGTAVQNLIKNQWISADNCPDTERGWATVLCLCESGKQEVVDYHHINGFNPNNSLWNITHWMPLPKPPQ